MNSDLFLQALRRELGDIPTPEADEIIEDYRSYFEDAQAAGRSIEDAVAAHGDPKRLAQELRAELGLRRWESERTPANFGKALLALGGLAALDILVLLPVLLLLGLVVVVVFFVLSLLGIIGIGHLLSLAPFSDTTVEGSAMSRLVSGTGLLAASLCGGYLLFLGLREAMTRLIRYARLHYRLLRPGTPKPAQSE
ncbi:DUF1700 domain-containing protein [Hoeflea sp.]|uniref:DUF1700 domain-containing protein n=1 Tax=Hoeflea sp. TaxID=1940281 RepID=UPI00374A35CC